MSKPSYLESLAHTLGFIALPSARTFQSDFQHGKGIVLGIREGFIIAIGLVSAGNHSVLNVLVRYRKGSPKEAIESTLKTLPAFKSFTARKGLKVRDNGIVASWPYAFKKPTPDAVLAFIDEIVGQIKGLALPLSAKCEDCDSANVSEVTLLDGIPGYHCVACQSRLATEKERAAEEYRTRPANYAVGIPAGAFAAFAAGTAWGLLVSWMEAGSGHWTPKLHALFGFFIAMAVAVALFKAMGKVTRAGQGIAIVLTLLGKFWGDSLFFTFNLLIRRNAHVSVNPLVWTARDYHLFTRFLNYIFHNFWAFKLYDVGTLVLAGDLACAFSLLWLPWGKLPKFTPVFENLGQIPESSRSRLAAAGK